MCHNTHCPAMYSTLPDFGFLAAHGTDFEASRDVLVLHMRQVQIQTLGEDYKSSTWVYIIGLKLFRASSWSFLMPTEGLLHREKLIV